MSSREPATAHGGAPRRVAPSRVMVLSAYRFHMFSLAAQLARLGMLERLVTAMPRRNIAELDPDMVASRPAIALVRHAVQRFARRDPDLLNRAVVMDFDRWASRRLTAATEVVHSLSSFGTETLGRAARAGLATVCDRGSWHILEQQAVLEDEATRCGATPPRFDPWIIDRELRDYDLCDRIFVPSTTVAASFARRGLGSKVAVVPYGVDLSMYRPPDGGRSPGALISVGTVGLRKGHRYLLEAFASLRARPIELTLVGPVDREFDSRALDLPGLTLTGAVTRATVAERLRQASIFVLASVEEGLPLSILQAMASGLAIVATRSTGAGDVVRHGIDGLIVEDRSAEALAAALTTLLDDPSRAEQMGRSARDRALEVGSVEAYGDRAAAALRGVVA